MWRVLPKGKLGRRRGSSMQPGVVGLQLALVHQTSRQLTTAPLSLNLPTSLPHTALRLSRPLHQSKGTAKMVQTTGMLGEGMNTYELIFKWR